MLSDELRRKLVRALTEQLAAGKIRRSDLLDEMPDLFNDILGTDSLDNVELVMAFEEENSVSLITVGDLIDFLQGDSDSAMPVAKR